MKRNLPPAFLGLIASILAGCATTPDHTAPPAASAAAAVPVPDKLDNLQKGMTTAELVAQWGQPAEKKTLKSSNEAEVWTYRQVTGSYQDQVATGTRMVPRVDPITGVQSDSPEPIYSQQTVEVVRTSDLLIYQGKLVEWKVRDEKRTKLH
ncbi:MAG TPA: hypothetical protein VG936_13175 [Lacunisphaera sp.]|nr:hypothetical protein [Lacunisphaera sp.]